MQLQTNTSELPDFIVRSTFGVALVSVLLLTPYGINNLIQERYILGILTLLIVFLCTISSWVCYKGRYHLGINLFGIAPAIMLTIMFATYELGVSGSYWAFLVVLGLYFILPEKWAVITNIMFVAIIIPISLTVIDRPVAIRFSSVLLGTSIFAFLAMHEITKQHSLVKEKAITDSLTGLYNRSILQYTLNHAIELNHRSSTVTTLLMLDVDNFKKINDVYGHDAGDVVLKSLGMLLKNYFRETDTLFRIGGEEFLVLSYNMDEGTALNLAEELRIKIENYSLIPQQKVTISIGVAEIQPDMDWREWMKICDEKLYCAKSNGRNQVFV